MRTLSSLLRPGAPWLGAALVWVLAGTLFAPASMGSRSDEGTPRNNAHVVGPHECSECHTSEFQVWRSSTHEKASRMLTRSKAAKSMAKALGIRRIKSEARCASCHFTIQDGPKKSKSLAGVSCESCHGPAKTWIDTHQQFGGDSTAPADESADHRLERFADCDTAGMVRVGQVHSMAGQCYGCHVIDDQELVNLAGHPSGSDFELVAWSQGEMRHNYVSGESKNAGASIERQRMLFVAGQMQKLNFSLRALARATEEGVFATEHAERAFAAIETLLQAAGLERLGEVDTVLAGSEDWKIEAGCKELAELVEKRVAHCSAYLENRTDGSELAGLDVMLPSASDYKGKPRS